MDDLFDTIESNIAVLANKIQHWLKKFNIPIMFTIIDEVFDSIYILFRFAKLNVLKRSQQNGRLKFTASTITLKQKLTLFGKLIILFTLKFITNIDMDNYYMVY